jgi:hypothetical protein
VSGGILGKGDARKFLLFNSDETFQDDYSYKHMYVYINFNFIFCLKSFLSHYDKFFSAPGVCESPDGNVL